MKIYKVRPFTDSLAKYPKPEAWEQAEVLSDFSFPWREEDPSPTQFRALHNQNYFYFRFEVEDHQLIAAEHEQVKLAVAQSDRVELFFRKDEHMNPYYCLEMDWKGRLLDNKASYHRQMDYQWSWPGGLSLQSRLKQGGYIVEGSLTKESLHTLDLIKQDSIQTGIFRADYYDSSSPKAKWISWVHPDSKQPDFHIPSAFGLLKFI